MAFQLVFHAFTLSIALSILTFLSIGIYNLAFHPLRRLPGPFLARASRLYYIFYKIRGTLPFRLKALHDYYGHTVRIAPDEISYNTSAAWQELCGHRSGAKSNSFEKDPHFYLPPEGSGRVNSIVNANDEDHRRMRKLQSHAFSEKALLAQEPIIVKYVNLLMEKLSEKAQDPEVRGVVDLVRWYNFTTFDLIGDLAFGRPFGCLTKEDLHFWITMIFESLVLGNAFQSLQYLPKIVRRNLMKLIPQKVKEERGKQFRFAQVMAKERISEGVSRGDGHFDFMSYILRANDEKGMSQPEIEEAANVYIIAGSETTASLLSGATYHLLQNPSVMQNLLNEIRTAFKTESDITLAPLTRLTYLNAVFEEALRLYPPAPSTLPRVVPPCGEIVLGEYIPGGTVVGINMLATFHSAKNFVLPEEFVPERWLGDERFNGDDKKAMQPFSYGPRNCIGKNLAYSEMRLILAKLLWKFDLELMEESRNWVADQKIYILWGKGPLKVRLREVQRDEKGVIA